MARKIVKNGSKMEFSENEKVVASYDYSDSKWYGARGEISSKYAKSIVKRFVSDDTTWISKFIGTDSWSAKYPNMGNVLGYMDYVEFIYNATHIYETKDMEINILSECTYRVYDELRGIGVTNGDEVAKVLRIGISIYGRNIYRYDIRGLIKILRTGINIIDISNIDDVEIFREFIGYMQNLFCENYENHITKSNLNKYKKMKKLAETDIAVLNISPSSIISDTFVKNTRKFGLEKSLNIFPSTVDDIIRLSKLYRDVKELIENRENSILLNDDEIKFVTEQFNSVLEGTYKVVEVLASKNQHVKEGALMNNCIGSYYNYLDNGHGICLVIDDESNKNRTDVYIKKEGDYVKIQDMRRSRNMWTGLMSGDLPTRFVATVDHKRFIEILNRVGGIK